MLYANPQTLVLKVCCGTSFPTFGFYKIYFCTNAMFSYFTNKFTKTALVFRKLWFVDCNVE